MKIDLSLSAEYVAQRGRCGEAPQKRFATHSADAFSVFMFRVASLAVLTILMMGGSGCAAQDDQDAWKDQGTAVTPKKVSSVYVPAPSSSQTSPSYSTITPQQREDMKRTMAQTAQQVGQMTKDFKEFYDELQKAVKDSGIVEEVNKMNLDGGTKPAGGKGGFGATDIRVADESMTVTVDLPGVDKRDLSVTLADASALRIRVNRDAADDPEEYEQAERYRGSFDKRVELPYKAVGKSFNAQLKDGVLTVQIPREKSAVTDEIPIQIQ